MQEGFAHRPVMLDEVLQGLRIKPQGCYLDGTFGRGGHAAAILEQLEEQGRLYAMDKDPEAVRAAQQTFGSDSRFFIHHGSFAELRGMAEQQGVLGRLDGVLLDLGVSSPQLDDASRGFSFQKDGALDMRMDNSQGSSAADWLAEVDEKTLVDVIRRYGEEKFARRIARAITEARKEKRLETTQQLAELIAQAVPTREKYKHPATRTFQAIRIFINRELEDAEQGLAQAVDALAPGGRLVVISFHSLEDRLVKRFMRKESKGEELPPDLPVMGNPQQGRLKLIGKALKASEQEVKGNPRARSAMLRIAEKVA